MPQEGCICLFFRDPLGDFAYRELKIKTDHESTKVRKHEEEKDKLDRTRAKSGEVARTFLRRKNGKRLEKAYEIRGMIEVARTRANFDTNFLSGLWTA